MKIVVEVAAVSLALGALVRGDVTPLKNPCLDAAHAAEPWCDATLVLVGCIHQTHERSDNRPTTTCSLACQLEEKIGSLDTVSPAIESLGIPAYNWWSEATHGISHVDNDVIEFDNVELRAADHDGDVVQPFALARDRCADRPRGARVHERGLGGLDVLGASDQPRS